MFVATQKVTSPERNKETAKDQPQVLKGDKEKTQSLVTTMLTPQTNPLGSTTKPAATYPAKPGTAGQVTDNKKTTLGWKLPKNEKLTTKAHNDAKPLALKATGNSNSGGEFLHHIAYNHHTI